MTTSYHRRARGFSLIEVLIAIVILSFGMLALAAVQGSLFRAGAETKARAIATAFAQRQIEDVRSFGALTAGAVSSYESISTQAITLPVASGTQFYGCEQVRRYRYDKPTGKFVRLNDVNYSISNAGVVTCADTSVVAAGAVTSGVPDFKEVKVSVGWLGQSGQLKTVEVADSVAGISPSDAIMLAQQNNAGRQGPTVWIRPPNRNADGSLIPAVVPIAIGGDQSAASSNPKPEQFVDGVSSATLFSVQTFTGSSTDEVLLNRKLDVAVASCVCSDNGSVSSTSNPAYQPTVWNGKQLGYMSPLTAAAGKKIGVALVDNSDRNIQNLCTVCCRDHHDSSDQPLKVDPYRALSSGAHAHYGYQQQGNGYNIAGGLLPVSLSNTNNQYVEACRLIRVNGLMRVAIDARQNNLMVTPLNSAGTNFSQSDFISRYSSFVSEYANYAAQNIPANYPGPAATYPATPLPSPTAAQLSTYSDIATPSAIALSTGDVRKMVTFGLYMDYLTPETLAAYNCARTQDNAGACFGFGTRNPLEFLPFYAVNVANLGAWDSAKTDVATVTNVGFNNQGTQSSDGGTVTPATAFSNTAFPVSNRIKISNSGLTNTAAIDPDDGLAANLIADAQAFQRQGGTGGTTDYHYIYLSPRTVENGINNLGNLLSVLPSSCSKVNGTGGAQDSWKCQFDSNSVSSLSMTLGGFTTQSNGTNGTITNRQICLPTSTTPSLSSSPLGTNGTTSEGLLMTLSGLGASSWTINFDVILDSQVCETGLTVVAASP